MTTTLVMIILSLAAQVGDSGDPVLEPCNIYVQDEVRIPAQEAGVLMKLSVKEGSRLSKGDILATIDDRQALIGKQIAQHGLDAAKQRYRDDIEERYASKAAEFAEVDWQRAVEANEKTPNAVPDIEVRQKFLGWERSKLQIEKAKKDRDLAKLDAYTKLAELQAAEMAVEMREIRAPFDGEVVDLYRHEAEWVNPGDPILKLVRFDSLYVEGAAYAKDFDREELLGRSVTVTVAKSRGREVSVPGTIVHVSQLVQGDGSYVVRAEVKNKQVGNSWVIQPGLKARMTIHLSPASQESRVQRQESERR